MKKPVFENFNEFMMATEVHQRPDATKRYEYGANPSDPSDLPYHFERRPEVGEDHNSVNSYLERIEALSSVSLNKISGLREESISPYIKRELSKSYKHLREAYLRLMEIGRHGR